MSSAPTETFAPEMPGELAASDLTIDGESIAPAAMPRDSSPTWELEMLISGAVTFSLFQLPPLLAQAYARWEPHTTMDSGPVLLIAYAFLKGALYTLIAAFVTHLAVRAYWVGLIGLNSVYPDGIQWDRVLMLGPLVREVYRERMPTLPRIIARLDNFASVIFSFAFLVVLVIGITLPVVGLGAGLAWLIAKLVFGGRYMRWIAYALLAIVVSPAVVGMYDLKRGATLDPNGRAARRVKRLAAIAYRLQLAGVAGPVLYTISSSGRRKTAYAAFMIALLGSYFVVLAEQIAGIGIVTVSDARYFSRASDANTVRYGFYESARDDGDIEGIVPSIQDDVISGPYVRLFIPYQPSRHDEAIAATCPRVPPLGERGLRLAIRERQTADRDSASARVLHCLAAMHAVRLNGERIPDLRFHFATHPRTGVDGIVAYIPTAPLPHGENVLSVMPPPRMRGSLVTAPLEPYLIHFWY